MKPVIGHPEYLIFSDGTVIRAKDKKKIKRCLGRRNEYRVQLGKKNARKKYGLAKLVALHYVPNPNNYEYVIFKDFNNQNCKAENLAWVDGQTFFYYSCKKTGGRIGVKKTVVERETAIKTCMDDDLRAYYITLDEEWLLECWKKIDKAIAIKHWNEIKSESYMYFLDRARRFSIIKNPKGLVLVHAKGLLAALKKEISFNMPLRKVLQTDESLRFIKNGSVD